MAKNIEQSNRDIAAQVITPKRKYFMPETLATVEADSLEEAVVQAKQPEKKEEKED